MPDGLAENPILVFLRQLFPEDADLYLIGGAVRDHLLGKDCMDYDFALREKPLVYARKVANHLKGTYYPLDEVRQTGRVLWTDKQGKQIKLDFSLLRGGSLEEDLYQRDLTINAIALNIHHPEQWIDPLRGAQDLIKKVVRSCSPRSFQEDPLRVLRGVRFALRLGFRIEPETWKQMGEAVPFLSFVSVERIRDELIHILAGRQAATAIRLLDRLKVLDLLLPEIAGLKGVEQSPPHHLDVYEHTLDVVKKLEEMILILTQMPDEEWQANLISGMASHRLGRYRGDIKQYLMEGEVADRPRRGLLILAALFHDSGKPATRSVDEGGRIRFFGHEERSEGMVVNWMQKYSFARSEVDWVAKVVRYHMRPIQFGMEDKPPSPKAVYRFYRDTGEAGLGTALFSLADILGVYGYTINSTIWQRQLDVVRRLLEAWWEKPQETVRPPALVSGNDLMNEFGIPPGPQVGVLLEAIREAQVSGEVKEKSEALELARQMLTQG